MCAVCSCMRAGSGHERRPTTRLISLSCLSSIFSRAWTSRTLDAQASCGQRAPRYSAWRVGRPATVKELGQKPFVLFFVLYVTLFVMYFPRDVICYLWPRNLILSVLYRV